MLYFTSTILVLLFSVWQQFLNLFIATTEP